MTSKSLGEIRPPAFLSRASLARELDMSESTIDEMVRRRVLPPPFELSRGCIRWSWQDIEAALATRKRGADSSPSDPFIEGARNATKTQEGRRDPS